MPIAHIPQKVIDTAVDRAAKWNQNVRIYADPASGGYTLATLDLIHLIPEGWVWLMTVTSKGKKKPSPRVRDVDVAEAAEQAAEAAEQAQTIRQRTIGLMPPAEESEQRKPAQIPAAASISLSEEAALVFSGLMSKALDDERVIPLLADYIDVEWIESERSGGAQLGPAKFGSKFWKSGFMAGLLGDWARSGAPTDQEAFTNLLVAHITDIRAIQKGRKPKEISAQIAAHQKAIYPSRPKGPATISRGQYRGLPSTGGAKVEGISHRFPAPDARLKISPAEERYLWGLVWQSYRAHLAGTKAERRRRAEKRREFVITESPTGTVSAGKKRKRRR